VLDWVFSSGDFRVWRVERNPAAGADPFPLPVVCQGNWAGIRAGHELVYLGSDRLLDWEPASGKFRVWLINRAATGNADPIPGVPQTTGQWTSLDSDHQLISLGSDRVLDWVASTGAYRVWRHEPTALGAADPLPLPVLTQGTWSSIRTGHRLIPLGKDRVLDWKPATGEYRMWRYDRNATGDPFPGEPEVVGKWQTLRTGHELLYVDGDRVLDWEPANGHFRLYHYARHITTLRRATVKLHLRVLTDPLVGLDTMMSAAKSLFASYGFDVIEISRNNIVVEGTSYAHLQEPQVDRCWRGDPPTQDQIDLFNLRDGIGPREIAAYFVRAHSPSHNGCSLHPVDRPGLSVARRANEFTLAHELAHVLGLSHLPVEDRSRLMNLNVSNVTRPLITAEEVDKMLASPFCQK
jgi:hypothetical protein